MQLKFTPMLLSIFITALPFTGFAQQSFFGNQTSTKTIMPVTTTTNPNARTVSAQDFQNQARTVSQQKNSSFQSDLSQQLAKVPPVVTTPAPTPTQTSQVQPLPTTTVTQTPNQVVQTTTQPQVVRQPQTTVIKQTTTTSTKPTQSYTGFNPGTTNTNGNQNGNKKGWMINY